VVGFLYPDKREREEREKRERVDPMGYLYTASKGLLLFLVVGFLYPNKEEGGREGRDILQLGEDSERCSEGD
jgi:hypothetical protein